MMFAPFSEVNRSNVRRWIPDAPEEIGRSAGGWGLKENHGKTMGKAREKHKKMMIGPANMGISYEFMGFVADL